MERRFTMKGSEILKMVEDVLPECVSVRSCKGIYKVVIHDEVTVNPTMVGLDPGKYGVVDLRLMVRLDTPVRDTDDGDVECECSA
jgi:hypothetical protein